jgi:hypothetical protein
LGVSIANDAVPVAGINMNPDDILVWPDGFWCFREELDPRFLRGDNYRAVHGASDEARRIISARPTLRHQPYSAANHSDVG